MQFPIVEHRLSDGVMVLIWIHKTKVLTADG